MDSELLALRKRDRKESDKKAKRGYVKLDDDTEEDRKLKSQKKQRDYRKRVKSKQQSLGAKYESQ